MNEEVQSVRINKIIPRKEADKIVEKLGFNLKYRGKSISQQSKGMSNNEYRYRQHPPSKYRGFRVKRVMPNVYYIMGLKK